MSLWFDCYSTCVSDFTWASPDHPIQSQTNCIKTVEAVQTGREHAPQCGLDVPTRSWLAC